MFESQPEDAETAAAGKVQEREEAYRLAGALLWHYRRFSLAWYPLLILPAVAAAFIGEITSVGGYVALSAVERGIELLFLWKLSRKVFSDLGSNAAASSGTFLRYLLIGFAFWLMLLVPVLAQTVALAPNLQLFFLLLLIPAVVLGLRYYFFFVPPSLGESKFRDIAQHAAAFTAKDSLAPLRLMLAPAAFLALAEGLCFMISPDGRHFLSHLAANLFAGVFWVLSSFTALGYVLSNMQENAWRQYGLEPYRAARFATLITRAQKPIGASLSAKNGLKLFAIAALIWLGNYAQLQNLPPPGTVAVDRITLDGNKVELLLNLEDAETKLAGLKPLNFSLAGEQGTVLAPFPLEATSEGEPALSGLPNKEKARLKIIFETQRDSTSLRQLEDLHLWYRAVRLQKLEMKNAFEKTK